MESKVKLPRPNLGGLLFAGALGVVVALVVYQAQVRGLIPFLNLSSKGPGLETRVIVSEENAIISVVDKTSSSVVAIGISQKVINPFDPFAALTKQDSTIGTGFVVSSEKGLIVTNKHVVSDTGTYTVVNKDGQKYEVKKIYRDPNFDLAIVQIDPNNLKPLELGDSSKLKVGQTVIAIGNALGKFTNTVTTGVVSGLGRKVVAGDIFEGGAESLDDLIQTDAAINPGNSGGPLLNSAGQVIGVNVAETAGAQNIGFALPINSVKKIVDDFSTKGFVSRPYLGIQYRFISKEIADLNKIPSGAYIQDVITDGPADKAGIKQGDIILKVNGQVVDSESVVSDVVSKSNIGQTLELTIFRGGKEAVVKVTLAQSPNQ